MSIDEMITFQEEGKWENTFFKREKEVACVPQTAENVKSPKFGPKFQLAWLMEKIMLH